MTEKHIKLELISLEHANSFFQLIEQNQSHLKKWFNWVENIKTLQDMKNQINDSIQLREQNSSLKFVVFYDDILVGTIGYKILNKKVNTTTAFIKYWIGSEYEGKGIMKEVLSMIIERIFTNKEADDIELHIAPSNHRSKALANYFNFRDCGIFDRAVLINNVSVYHNVYNLSTNEWLINCKKT